MPESIGLLQRRPRAVRMPGEHLAFGCYALVHLDDALVELLRQDDVAGEQLGPVLVADLERVGEALGDDEERALALALEEGVGRDRRAHLDRGDRAARQLRVGAKAQYVADAGQGGVAIAAGIVREQLPCDERSVGPPRDHVGEGTAAVDPELPPGAAHAPMSSARWPRSRAAMSNSPSAIISCVAAGPCSKGRVT